MRAVVAGGAGFIGSHLCDRLIADGSHVECIDNFATGQVANICHLLSEKYQDRFVLHRHDIVDGVEIDGPVDVVLNLASPASPADYLRLPIETLRAGSEGARHLLELAGSKNARFLLASTSEVYGDPLVHPQDEDYWGNVNPIGPRSVYDEAKRFGESVTTAYRRHRQVDTVVVRIFNTFGPRMRPDDGRAIPTFLDQALSGQAITVRGDGSRTRSFCYVSDLVDGLMRAIRSGHPGPLNLGNPREVTILELAEMVRDRCDSSSPIVLGDADTDDPRRRQPDITLARSVLGWQPRTSLEVGLDNTVAWMFRAAGRSPDQKVTRMPSPR